MIKKYSLVLLLIAFAVFSASGQIVSYEFPGTNSLVASQVNANVTSSDMVLSQGTISTNITTGTYFPNEPYIEETGGWDETAQNSAKNFQFTITADAGYEFSITNIAFKAYATSAGPSAFGFAIDGNNIYSTNAPDASIVVVNQSVSGQNGLSSATIKIQGWLNGSRSSSGSGVFRLDEVVVSGTVSTVSGPTISVSETSISNLNYILNNGPSTSQSLLVGGTNLNSDILLTAPTNFEVSTNASAGYTNTLTLVQSTGTVNNTTIYVRLKSGLSIGNYNGNIEATSNSAATKSTTMSGNVMLAPANVVITEIMYNTSGTDDEWIEICNTSGINQDLNGHLIKVNENLVYSFSSSTVISEGQCITVALGDNGTSPFNPACPFTADYGNPTETNKLTNSGSTISIIAPDNNSVVDTVNYSSSNGGNGNGASLHIIDIALDNSSTSNNWQEVADGGTPGTNSLTSACSTPELQLKNSSGTIQNCGSFSIDFGSQAVGFNTDQIFTIENDGNVDLNITSISLSSDFSIISPTLPFTISALNSQIITVRFSPTSNGTINTTLTINSNDADNGSCSIDLTGIGFTPVPEINVEGDIGTFPDISDGDTTPSGTDNTLFAAQSIGTSQTKSYIINNEGTADLTISSVTISGVNASDFQITLQPYSSIISGENSYFEITFTPQALGIRNATVTINNNDSDENPFTFAIRGEGLCVSNNISLSPAIGPVGTVVTISGSNLNGATVMVGSISVSPIYLSDSEIEIVIPDNAVTSNVVINDSFGCTSSKVFNVIDNKIASCEGSTFLTELFISEITDATYGSLTYIEIYNPTGSPINLSDYSISIYPNGKTDYLDGTHQNLSGNLPSGKTFVITTGTSGLLGNIACNVSGGNGSYGDLISSSLLGINKIDNNHDYVGLYKSGALIDAFGVFGDKNWMDNLHTTITGDRGFNFKRINNTLSIPEPSFNDESWNIIDWVGSGQVSCDDNDYSDIGEFDFSTGKPPSISVQPSLPSSSCDLEVTLNVLGIEGFTNGNSLVYQWFYMAPGESDWTEISISDTNFTGQQSTTLTILNALESDGYQYYAQVRENTFSCYIASKSVRLKLKITEWDGNSWSKGNPNSNTIAIINGNYNTNTNGSFSACQLYVKNGAEVIIEDDNYIEVTNNLLVDGTSSVNPGTMLVRTSGNFIQINDDAFVSVSGTGKTVVEKETAPMNDWYEYTYWSSPVSGETIDNALSEASPERRFWFNAANYRDSFAETNNNNAEVAGQDDIDDNGNDWTFAGGLNMEPGRGYASTNDPILFNLPGTPPYRFLYEFIGSFNNGLIEVPIYRNDAEMDDNNWNFIGNPYPSAIDVDAFISANSFSLDGAIYLWSQGTPPSHTNNGNEPLNFNQNDYAVINGTGEIAGGDGIKPNRKIPSGQGFFVVYKNGGDVLSTSGDVKEGIAIFNNGMRSKDANSNSQFFRTRSTESANKLWLNLSSDTGIFNQILIGYIDGATNNDDGFYYDAPTNKGVNSATAFYTWINNSLDKQFVIQGRNPTDLGVKEIIKLGFSTQITSPTIYTISIENLQGDFLNSEEIFLIDNLIGKIHSLKNNAYNFTSEKGIFENRFQVVFQNSLLDFPESKIEADELSIVELNNERIKISVSEFNILQIKIIDYLGRQLYDIKGSKSEEIILVPNLKQGAFIAKLKLSNGQEITKKAIKTK